MDNAQKAIMIGVGLFLTILVISVVLLITNLGIGTTKNAGERVVSISAGLQSQLITQYDRKTITGQDVAFAITQYNVQLNRNLYVNNATVVGSITNATAGTPVAVTAGTPAVTTHYSAVMNGTLPNAGTVGALLDRVNVSGTYTAFLVKDPANMNVVGLYFLAQ